MMSANGTEYNRGAIKLACGLGKVYMPPPPKLRGWSIHNGAELTFAILYLVDYKVPAVLIGQGALLEDRSRPPPHLVLGGNLPCVRPS